jgi:hypothetical protein
MPIIGSLAGASARSYGFALAAGSSISSTSDLIAITTGTVDASGATSVTLSSIPSTYKHLQIRMYSKVTGSAINDVLRFNGDTGNNYNWFYLNGDGAGSIATGNFSGSSMCPGVSATDSWSSHIITITNYADTSKLKTMKSIFGINRNGLSTWMGINSGLWNSTAAINSITFTGGTFTQYSQFALYGVK